jgi:hypothetical protein
LKECSLHSDFEIHQSSTGWRLEQYRLRGFGFYLRQGSINLMIEDLVARAQVEGRQYRSRREELGRRVDLQLCGMRWEHEQSHGKRDNYPQSNLQESCDRGLGRSAIDFD